MKRLIVIALTAGMMALGAAAEDTDTTMTQMRGMGMQGGMAMQRPGMQRGYMMPDCPVRGSGMMGGGMGMMGNPGMMGGMGMMGPGMMGGMMNDPEIQQMMMDEMMDHQKQMMQERMAFQNAMRKKVMGHPKVMKMMLSNLLEHPQALEKLLKENPDLKAALKKAL